jgi:RNA polymerase sigma factor (TIGR02999 family)
MDPQTITLMLKRIRAGEARATEELIAAIYDDCRRRAHQLRLHERTGHSLNTGDLVHEGLMRLLRDDEIARAANRNQLFWAYARAVRQTLVDHARGRAAQKRGGDWARAPLDDLVESVEHTSRSQLLVLDEALELLAQGYAEEARVIEMHYFGNYTLPEIASALEVSLSTVERRHRFARAWLRERLTEETEP